MGKFINLHLPVRFQSYIPLLSCFITNQKYLVTFAPTVCLLQKTLTFLVEQH